CAPVAVLSRVKFAPSIKAITPGTSVMAPITVLGRQVCQRKLPVARSSARTLPPQVAPLMVVIPPAAKILDPFHTADEMLPCPHCGHAPAPAICLDQTGPLLSEARLKA